MIFPFIISIGTCASETHVLERAQKPIIMALCSKCYNDRDLKSWYTRGAKRRKQIIPFGEIYK